MENIKAYKTVKEEKHIKFTEKKSIFISHIKPISSEEEAKDFVNSIKSKYSDANHNVFAYILQGTEIARYSDDGEPSGTAGMPALEVLKREGLCGVCVVITRYFGGILLGAGGLTRAYAKSTKLAVDESGASIYVPFTTFTLTISYSDSEKILRDLAKFSIRKSNVAYTDKVQFTLSCEKEDFDVFINYIKDITAGKANFEINGERYEEK